MGDFDVGRGCDGSGFVTVDMIMSWKFTTGRRARGREVEAIEKKGWAGLGFEVTLSRSLVGRGVHTFRLEKKENFQWAFQSPDEGSVEQMSKLYVRVSVK